MKVKFYEKGDYQEFKKDFGEGSEKHRELINRLGFNHRGYKNVRSIEDLRNRSKLLRQQQPKVRKRIDKLVSKIFGKNLFRRKRKLRPYQKEMLNSFHRQISGRALRSDHKTLIIDKTSDCGPSFTITAREAVERFDYIGRILCYGFLNFETMTEYNGFLVEV